jgi:hypothetical protein
MIANLRAKPLGGQSNLLLPYVPSASPVRRSLKIMGFGLLSEQPPAHMLYSPPDLFQSQQEPDGTSIFFVNGKPRMKLDHNKVLILPRFRVVPQPDGEDYVLIFVFDYRVVGSQDPWLHIQVCFGAGVRTLNTARELALNLAKHRLRIFYPDWENPDAYWDE